MLSSRIEKIEESGIRKVFELATKNNGEYINLSIGQPHFSAPEALKKQLKLAVEGNFNAYTPTNGLVELREKILDKLKKENGIETDFDQVMVTAGVAAGIFLALSATINPGDEVILPDPYFVLYKQVLNYLGAKIVYLDTYPDFGIDLNKMKDLISTKTKLIIINSPNNPTGMVYSEKTLRGVAEIAKKKDLIVLSDEIYEKFDYDDRFFSIGSVYEKTITLNGFSKSHSITGWRIGYAQGPKEIIQAMNKLQQYTFVCAPSMVQKALVKGFDVDLAREVRGYGENRNYICENLKNSYDFKESKGAFYLFAKKPAGVEDFGQKLIDNGLLTVPGEVFSERNDYFRLSFAVEFDKLKKGVEILKSKNIIKNEN
jgi:aspartate aminotransferase/aminotransferase